MRSGSTRMNLRTVQEADKLTGVTYFPPAEEAADAPVGSPFQEASA